MSDRPATPLASRIPGRILLGVFAGIGLLAAAAVIFLAVTVLGWEHRERREAAPVQAGADATEIFSVGAITPLRGTRFDEIVIARGDAGDGGSASYSSRGKEADERNVILLDSTSGTSRKLLPDNTRRIVGRDYLPAVAGRDGETNDEGYAVETAATPKPPLAYYVIRVQAADAKSQDVLVGDLNTGRQAILLKGIDGVERVWMQSATRMGVLMRQGRKLHYRAIEIPDLKIVAQHPVAID
ncbi:hypothetical protein TPR58_08115 [Sphingomonas sp. HF-S3]|uniref:Uncharacterized protein n=1 Tax=Sphingomonas rustica TaxID=3103142 RepID=A0ABV0B6A1_9SPHN